jgi:PKD repeat protein
MNGMRLILLLRSQALLPALTLILTACVSTSPLEQIPAFPVLASLSATPSSGPAPLSVTFSAGASSGGVAPLRYDYDFNGDGVVDSANTGPVVQRVFNAPGSYSVRLTVTDAVGTTAHDTVSVLVLPASNQLPVASLLASPTSGSAPLQLAFDASGSSDSDGSIVRYDYDFDSDGIWDAYDSGPQVNWSYVLPGSYTATLRVTDSAGAQATTQLAIFVNALPFAVLTASATSAAAGSTIIFSAAGSGDPDGALVSYEWDADGNGSFEQHTGLNPQLQVLFPLAGSFTVRLRVTDDFGAQAVAQIQVEISS